MTDRRFTEHKNVIDLVYWRRVIDIMWEFKCGAVEAIRWMEQEEAHYRDDRVRRMWDNYEPFRGDQRVPDEFVRNGVIWVDEESYWRDDSDHHKP